MPNAYSSSTYFALLWLFRLIGFIVFCGGLRMFIFDRGELGGEPITFLLLDSSCLL